MLPVFLIIIGTIISVVAFVLLIRNLDEYRPYILIREFADDEDIHIDTFYLLKFLMILGMIFIFVGSSYTLLDAIFN